MELKLYINKSPANKIKKEITDVATIEGSLVGDFNEKAPEIRVKDISDKANYASIDNKFYFISNITHLTNDVIALTLEIDYLYTYKDDILNMPCFVELASNAERKYLDNPQSKVLSKDKQFICRNYDKLGFDEDEPNGCYILAVTNDGGHGVYETNNTNN